MIDQRRHPLRVRSLQEYHRGIDDTELETDDGSGGPGETGAS